MQEPDKASRRQHKSRDKDDKSHRKKDASESKAKKDKKKRDKSSKSKAKKSEKKSRSEAKKEYPVEIKRPEGLALDVKDYDLDIMQPSSGFNSKFMTTF